MGNSYSIGYHLVDGFTKAPIQKTDGSVGYDGFSPRTYAIPPGESVKIPTGVCLNMPSNMYATIHERSSFNANDINIFGIIDSDYHDQLYAVTRNHGKRTVVIKEGERFYQILFKPKINTHVIPWDGLETEEKGENKRNGGFGSTGNF